MSHVARPRVGHQTDAVFRVRSLFYGCSLVSFGVLSSLEWPHRRLHEVCIGTYATSVCDGQVSQGLYAQCTYSYGAGAVVFLSLASTSEGAEVLIIYCVSWRRSMTQLWRIRAPWRGRHLCVHLAWKGQPRSAHVRRYGGRNMYNRTSCETLSGQKSWTTIFAESVVGLPPLHEPECPKMP